MPEQNTTVPYIAYESSLARMDRANKRLWIALVVVVIALLVSISLWVYVFTQYEHIEETYTATQDGMGINIFSRGDVSYGPEDND